MLGQGIKISINRNYLKVLIAEFINKMFVMQSCILLRCDFAGLGANTVLQLQGARIFWVLGFIGLWAWVGPGLEKLSFWGKKILCLLYRIHFYATYEDLY